MMDKPPKTKTELEALVLTKLRAAPQCAGAVTVVPYDKLSFASHVGGCEFRPGHIPKSVSARCATSLVASSSGLISPA
jgi:hypothetical protein